ncbi:MAG: hypothetical protein ABJF10_08110 [Chthoniobacter sp.]|uniref:hypothetical protein n=1 Tax=Chthoniobacter sp. TaxID=2510640 RepID=UPI0032A7362B
MTATPATSRAPSLLFAHAIPGLILAVVVTVLFWWNPFGRPPQWATFHVLLKSDVAGQAQLLPDVDRTGLHKGHLLSQPVEGGSRLNHVQFKIPAGRLCAFVLNGLDRSAEVEIQKCWITTGSDEVAAIIPPATMQLSIADARAGSVAGSVRFHTKKGEVLTGLHFTPRPPIDLSIEPPPPLWEIAVVFLVTLVGCVLISVGLVNRREAMVRALSRARAWCEARPRCALLAAAMLSVMVCAFPVIFGGKSYVSPNNGMPLLYERFPTVPGSPGGSIENPVGSDIGATIYWHFPASMIEYRAIFQDGEFPLWSRYTWCGVTFFGQLFTMIGDPLHWLTIITGGAAWAWDTTFIVAKILFALGIGWLVWRMAGSLPVALVCTLSAPYLGFFAYRFCHASNFAVCYAPWLLVPWIEAARARTHRQAALWAGLLLFVDWCQINSGTAKEPMILVLFLNAVGGWIMVTEHQSWGWRLRRLGMFAGANVLFVLLSAPLWLVFLEALGKAWTPYDEPQIYQVQPGLAIGLFDDIFYRQIESIEFHFSQSANFFVLLGVAWAFIRIRTLVRDRYFQGALLAAIPAAALIFGVIPPWIAASIPLIKNIYHFEDTFSCVLFVVLFIIAGFGLRECLARRNSPQWFGDWVCVMGLVGVLLAGYFGFIQATHRVARSFLPPGESIPKSPFFVDYATVLIIALMVLPLALRAAFRDRLAGPAWALVAVCMFATLHFRHGMYFETRFDLYTMNPKTRMDLRDLHSPAVDAIHAATATEPARVVGLDWTMTPGFSTVLNLETISGPDVMQDPAMLYLASGLGITRTYVWRLIVASKGYEQVHRGLDFFNVRYLLNDLSEPAPGGVRLVGSYDLNLYESETAWPRAFFTDAVVPFQGVQDLCNQIQRGDGRPFAAVLPELRARLPLPSKDAAQRVVTKAEKYRLTNNTTTFEINAPSPGMAVLSEFNPDGDILASVDGQPVPCLRANLVFRGVYIEKPGRHVVKFAYWPRLLGPALWIGAVGLVGLLVSIGYWFRVGVRRAGTVPAKTVSPTCLTNSP